jgi:hypothetical protein
MRKDIARMYKIDGAQGGGFSYQQLEERQKAISRVEGQFYRSIKQNKSIQPKKVT